MVFDIIRKFTDRNHQLLKHWNIFCVFLFPLSITRHICIALSYLFFFFRFLTISVVLSHLFVVILTTVLAFSCPSLVVILYCVIFLWLFCLICLVFYITALSKNVASIYSIITVFLNICYCVFAHFFNLCSFYIFMGCCCSFCHCFAIILLLYFSIPLGLLSIICFNFTYICGIYVFL